MFFFTMLLDLLVLWSWSENHGNWSVHLLPLISNISQTWPIKVMHPTPRQEMQGFELLVTSHLADIWHKHQTTIPLLIMINRAW